MGRKATAWYRANADAWYVELDGRQIKLANGKRAKADAGRQLRHLLAERERRGALPLIAPPVGEILARWLADCDHRVAAGELSALTRDSYEQRLAGLADACGSIIASRLRPRDVLAWLDSHPRWGPTRRHDAVAALKAALNWAVREGYLAVNPIAAMRKPTRNEWRAHVLDPADLPRVLAAIHSDDFRALLSFLWLTGARPSEAARIEARHVDLTRCVVELPHHKTRRHTGAPRLIWLAAEAVDLVAPLVERHPAGPIFRNARGNAWSRWAMNDQMCRIRKRCGIDKGLSAGVMRHLFATDVVERTGSLPVAAELLGHRSTTMVGRRYSRLADRHAHLRSALDAVRPATASPPASQTPPSAPTE
jgi:integrase